MSNKAANAALTPRRICLRMGLRMQFGANRNDSKKFVGVSKHSQGLAIRSDQIRAVAIHLNIQYLLG